MAVNWLEPIIIILLNDREAVTKIDFQKWVAVLLQDFNLAILAVKKNWLAKPKHVSNWQQC